MKLVSFQNEQGCFAGVLINQDLILNVGRLHEFADVRSVFPSEMKSLLASDRLDELRGHVNRIAADVELLGKIVQAGVAVNLAKGRLIPPVPNPGLILSSGGAYRDHLSEMAVQGHSDPIAFIKSAAAICGPNDDIVLPSSAPDMVDWEGEFACVIGKTCYEVTEEEALDYVAGYTLINDVSARDWTHDFLTASNASPLDVFAKGSMNVLGKQFPTFCPMGPCVVTTEDLRDPGSVSLMTIVNGQVMQSANTRDLIHGIGKTISYFSKWFRFQPGDVISTGTPAGIGFAKKPPRFLRSGDVVEVRSEQIGSIINKVVREGR